MIQRVRAAGKVAFFVIFLTALTPSLKGEPGLPVRALWMVRTSMVSRESVDRAVRFAAKNGFNHLFVQVRGRDDAFYHSRFVPRPVAIEDDDFDPLRYAVLKGHQFGLKVHAWMNVYLVWSSSKNPQDRRHILLRYPEWEDKRSGIGAISSGKNSNSHRFLSPAHPGVTEYLLMVLEEVLLQYDIDGLHLDYIRYGDSDFGYNEAGRKEFERRHGVDPILFSQNSPNPVGGMTRERRRILWERWNRYRRDSVTEFVRRCNNLILEEDPTCILTAAVKPEPVSAKSRFFQEWDRWLAEGLVDFVVPMNYTPNLRLFAQNIDTIYDSVPTKYWPGIIMGIAIYNQDAFDVRDKIKYAKVVGFPGISLFSYDARKNEPDFFLPISEEIKP